VRVCVLAASHSPAGRLLTGRLERPEPLHPGTRFDIRPTLPDQLRIGMRVHLIDPAIDPERIAVHAVVEDIVAGVARAAVAQALRPGFTPSARASARFLTR
jgi:hypothetical protein